MSEYVWRVKADITVKLVGETGNKRYDEISHF